MSYYEYLSHSSSDHSPVCIHLQEKPDKGFSPLKFFNFWQNIIGFHNTLKESWEVQVHGNPTYQLVAKLKYLKAALKDWRKQTFDNPSCKVEHIRDEHNKAHKELSTNPSNVQLQQEELSLQDELRTWLPHEEDQWKKKSKESWMRLGDKNTKFFYSVVKTKQARNNIYHLLSEEGKKVVNWNQIKVLAPAFYEALFNQHSGMFSQKLW